MKLEFRESFSKDIDNITERRIKLLCASVIEKIENANSLTSVPQIKKLKGYKTFYRIRVGEYRIGIEYRDKTIVFWRVLLRKDIYKYFP